MVVDSDLIIQLRGVTLNYGRDDVVKNADLDIKRGETKVILGPSGVGKSTILKALLGLLKPSEGKVFVHQKEITGLSESQLVPIRRKMAMVFQQGALFDAMSVADNVSYRLREIGKMKPEKIRSRVHEVLKFVGLQHSTELRPSQLSGGMKKRVAIARALASSPEIFLFDEPTVGLDPINLYNVEQLILKMKQLGNSTIVIVTHDVGSAYRLADSIVMLYNGNFIFNGTPHQLKAAKDIRIRAFLDPANLETFQ